MSSGDKKSERYQPQQTGYDRIKRRDSFDPQRVRLLGEDIICMVSLLEILHGIFFFL